MLRRVLLPALLAILFAAATPALASAEGGLRTHVVANGQRLGSIAKRYNVTIEALCYANDISRRDPIHPGQRLVVPARTDKDGSQARTVVLRSRPTRAATTALTSYRAATSKGRAVSPSWRDFSRRPRRKGYLDISSHNKKWRGLVIDSRGRLRTSAKQRIAELLSATGDHPGVPDRLLRLLVSVSDTFGGRKLMIVSGYRTTSYFRDSRHKTSQAIDFSVIGVPNAVVRDYLRTLQHVGVGYYPNSSFLHLDVRPATTYWVNYAGPGEAPRRTQRGQMVATPTDVDDAAEEEAETSGAKGPAAAPAEPEEPSGASEQAEEPAPRGALPKSDSEGAPPRP